MHVYSYYGQTNNILYLLADFKPPSPHKKWIRTVIVAGIVTGALLFIIVLGLWIRKHYYLRDKISTDKGT